ncbi:MAG: SDR family oxidoreductase [Pedobacter sp.]|nr:SDR family oxidoreductase [Pedobacter sp.]
MKTILVTGSNGLLGQKITERILQTKQFNLIATSKGANRYPVKEGYTYAEMDILDPVQVLQVVKKVKPDAIINTAAMTNVDTSHEQPELAQQLNVVAVQTLADIAASENIQFVHLSTDFIFDGADGPYDEEAAPNPLSEYGRTKLAGEEVVKCSSGPWVIIRTILVYGIVNDMSRSNIVLWAKGALESNKLINVVNDQWRMPTLAEDLADGCLLAVEKNAQGIFNISGKDMMSVSELVAEVADYWELDKHMIKEISSESLNQAAKRPVKTGFILAKAINELGYQPRSFKEGLAIVDEQLRRRA